MAFFSFKKWSLSFWYNITSFDPIAIVRWIQNRCKVGPLLVFIIFFIVFLFVPFFVLFWFRWFIQKSRAEPKVNRFCHFYPYSFICTFDSRRPNQRFSSSLCKWFANKWRVCLTAFHASHMFKSVHRALHTHALICHALFRTHENALQIEKSRIEFVLYSGRYKYTKRIQNT